MSFENLSAELLRFVTEPIYYHQTLEWFQWCRWDDWRAMLVD